MKNNASSKKTVPDFIKIGLETKLFAYAPFKGTIYFLPSGYFLWAETQKYLDNQFQSLGVENVYFPSLIPYSLFQKEKKHIQGFAPEVFLIEKAGEKQLSEKIVLRPTSEVIFCHFFATAVHSYRDLPILYNQWVNVFRWEQNPNPFLRNMEFLWNEGHTLHLNQTEAIIFCQKILKIYQKCLEKFFFIPVFIGKKSELEKFAGAKITWALETLLPDGQFLQLATVHYFAQNFAQNFAIKYLDTENKFQYPNQTSWGISTRSLAGLIKTHYDLSGLVLPFNLAKIQVAILPILTKEKKSNFAIKNYCQTIQSKLSQFDLRFNNWQELKDSVGNLHYQFDKSGIPLKIEIGLKEWKEKTITFKFRNELTKTTLAFSDFLQKFIKLKTNFDNSLYQKALQKQNISCQKISDFATYINLNKNKAFEVWFCNKVACELIIKKKTQTVSRILWKTDSKGKCFQCQTPTSWKALFGRSY